MNDWIQYHKSQWMSDVLKWNVSDAKIRNNNLAESQNFVLGLLLGKHPYLFSFVEGLQKKSADTVIRNGQLLANQYTRAQDRDENRKNVELMKLYEKLDKNKINYFNFLIQARTIMRKRWKVLEKQYEDMVDSDSEDDEQEQKNDM